MTSPQTDDNSLPGGWILCDSKSTPGKKYYFNKRTGKSSWTKPQILENFDQSKKALNNSVEEKKEQERCGAKRRIDCSLEETSSKRSNTNEKPPDNNRRSAGSTVNVKAPTGPVPANCKTPANYRMCFLRTKLSDDAEKEKFQNPNLPSGKKPSNQDVKKISPKPENNRRLSHTDSTENKSKSNESIINSPSSDSIHSTSPSQFYTASKILTSMKAHLPTTRMRAMDTFSFIEEGICNQTPEYPPTKHPSTPPQFSEVSKIVSAMKSKLSGKFTRDSEARKSHTSANERLASLRTSLDEGVKPKMDVDAPIASINQSVINHRPVKSCDDGPIKTCVEDDDDDVIEVAYTEGKNCSNRSPPKAQQTAAKVNNNAGKDLILVVDTNVFIQEIDIIKNVLGSHIKGYAEQPTLLIPWRVVNELDRLKDNNNGTGPVCKRARAAMDYLYQELPKNDRIKGQTLRDANSHIYPCESPDDEILNCCLQQAERGSSVILLSNDRNFRNKAVINKIKSVNIIELKQLLEDGPHTSADVGLPDTMNYYESCLYELLSNILENEMRAKYNNLWEHVLFKVPPWSLLDVLLCLLKHWIAVFSEVFPRIEPLLLELKNVLQRIHDRGLNKLAQADMVRFKELAIEVATKCLIIPEYMKLAKLTVERLNRVASRPKDLNNGLRQNAKQFSEKMVVIDAFESVWSVFSSYCAKLSSLLGVTHDLEDKTCNTETLEDLSSKWTVLSNQIYSFTFAIKGILSESNVNHPQFDEQLTYLVSIFRESLELVPTDNSVINRHNMRLFCLNSCDLLNAAYTKFAQLTQLLDECRNRMVGQ